jgi:hypothetical protein
MCPPSAAARSTSRQAHALCSDPKALHPCVQSTYIGCKPIGTGAVPRLTTGTAKPLTQKNQIQPDPWHKRIRYNQDPWHKRIRYNQILGTKESDTTRILGTKESDTTRSLAQKNQIQPDPWHKRIRYNQTLGTTASDGVYKSMQP